MHLGFKHSVVETEQQNQHMPLSAGWDMWLKPVDILDM